MMKEGPIVHYLNILLDLESKFKIQDTAYLVNVTQEGTKMYLHWIDNGKDTQMEIFYRSALFVKTDTAKSYYVRFRKLNECYITEYNDLYRKDEHLYYSKHISGKLIECGSVKGDVFVPFKQFEANGIMTEFVYGYNNETDDIDVSTKTGVYHGTYMNNPKKHYPRSIEEQTTVNPKPSTKPEPAKDTISTDWLGDKQSHTRGSTEKPNEFAEKPKLTTNTKQIVEGDNWVLSNGDKIQENTQYKASTLQFEESYQDTSLITLQINILNFPFLKSLIFGDHVQDGVKGELLEISGCPLLENIKFGMRSFTYYQIFEFASMICYCIVNRFIKIEINRNDSFSNDRTY